jgi:hypothetical protein
MNKNLLKNIYGKVLGREAFWAINKHCVRIIGLEETLVLQHLIDYDNQDESIANPKYKGKICPTYQQISRATHLSEKKIQRIIKSLSELELIEIKLDQLPARNHYTINYISINKLMEASSHTDFVQTRDDIFGGSSNNNLRV